MTAEQQTRTFDSLSPVTGDVVGTHSVHTEADVRSTVDRARRAAAWWAGLTFAQRSERLLMWKGVMTRRIHQLAALVHEETGKPHADALLEVVLAVDHLDWAARNAPKVLGRHRVRSGLLMSNMAATVEYPPLGVIGVIGPWNYPVFTPMGSIAYALAAANAVVFKPSELTPGVGAWLAATLAEVVPEEAVLQVVTGLGETGAALCRSGVDKVAFTGSPETGRKVMSACAETLTPVLIEAGGKDALVVDADADLDDAADAALWGACANAGQTCAGVERVYVHERVYDAFCDRLVAQGSRVAAHEGGQIGPITMPEQVEVIRRHITDALARGGRALLGGADAVGERYVQPTVLVDVPEDSAAVQQETFGPTVTVRKVRDMDEAVRLANGTPYGLGSAVFGKAHAMDVAARIRSGMTAVNSVISFAAIPSLPFGGVGESGFGRIHGADGLKEFTYAKAIARQRFRPVINLTSFGRSPRDDSQVVQLITLRHGRHGTIR